jgi:hypothetical protein
MTGGSSRPTELQVYKKENGVNSYNNNNNNNKSSSGDANKPVMTSKQQQQQQAGYLVESSNGTSTAGTTGQEEDEEEDGHALWTEKRNVASRETSLGVEAGSDIDIANDNGLVATLATHVGSGGGVY